MASEKEAIDSKNMFPPPSLLTVSGANGKSNNEQSPYDHIQQKTLTSSSSSPMGAGSPGYYQNVTQKGKLILPTALWILLIVAGLCFLSLLATLNKSIGTLSTLVELEEAKAKTLEKIINEQESIDALRFSDKKENLLPLSQTKQENKMDSPSEMSGENPSEEMNTFIESPIPMKHFDADNNQIESTTSWFSFPAWTSLEPPYQRRRADDFMWTNNNEDRSIFSTFFDDMFKLPNMREQAPFTGGQPAARPPMTLPIPPAPPAPASSGRAPMDSMIIIASGELPQEHFEPRPTHPFRHRAPLTQAKSPLDFLMNEILSKDEELMTAPWAEEDKKNKNHDSFITANVDKINININPSDNNNLDGGSSEKISKSKSDIKEQKRERDGLYETLDGLLSKLIDKSAGHKQTLSGNEDPFEQLISANLNTIDNHHNQLPSNHHHHHHSRIHSNKRLKELSNSPFSPISTLLLPLEFSRPSSELISPPPAPLPLEHFKGSLNQPPPPPMFGRPKVSPSESIMSFSFMSEGQPKQFVSENNPTVRIPLSDQQFMSKELDIPLGMPRVSLKKNGDQSHNSFFKPTQQFETLLNSPFKANMLPLEQLFGIGDMNKQENSVKQQQEGEEEGEKQLSPLDESLITSFAQSLLNGQENNSNLFDRNSHGAIRSEQRRKDEQLANPLDNKKMINDDTIILINGEPLISNNNNKLSSLAEDDNKSWNNKKEKKANDFKDLFELFFGPPPNSKLVVKPTIKTTDNNILYDDNKSTTPLDLINQSSNGGENNNFLSKNIFVSDNNSQEIASANKLSQKNIMTTNDKQPDVQVFDMIENQTDDNKKMTSLLDGNLMTTTLAMDDKKKADNQQQGPNKDRNEIVPQQLMDELFGTMLSLPQFGKDEQVMKVSEQSSGPKDAMTCECVRTNSTSSSSSSNKGSTSSNSSSSRGNEGNSTTTSKSSNSTTSSSSSSSNSTNNQQPLQPIGFAAVPMRPNGAGGLVAPAALATSAQSSGTSQDRPQPPPPNGSNRPQPPPPFGAAPNSLLNALNNSTGNFIPRLLNRLNSTMIPCDGNSSTKAFPNNNNNNSNTTISSPLSQQKPKNPTSNNSSTTA